jgi:hypothetical protein
MPKVKTITPGRLTGISGLTQTAAKSIGRQKDMEYAFEMSEWQKQNARLERLQEEEINTTLEMMKKVTDAEAVGRGDFSVGLRDGLMAQAGKVARINSRMKLGDYDVVKGSQELASIDKQLETFTTAAAPVQSLYNALVDSKNKNAGEVGKLMLPTDPEAARKQNDVVQVVNTMFSPNSGKIKTIFGDDGSVILEDENGAKISLNALNDIMTGENPEYPLQFIQSPDEALDPLYKTFEKETSQLEGYREKQIIKVNKGDGTIEEVEKTMYNIGEGSKYREDLKKVVQPILDDAKQMDNYWPNLVGNNDTPWENSEEQRGEAQKLLVDRIDNLYGPKVDVITSPSGETTYEDRVRLQISPSRTQSQIDNLNLSRLRIANDKEIAIMKNDFKKGEMEKFENGLKNFVDRNIYHTREAFKLPEGRERNEEIVKLINEASKGTKGDFTVSEDGKILDGAGGEMTGVLTKFGFLEYLNKLTILDDFKGEAANKAKTYVGSRNIELSRPAQEQVKTEEKDNPYKFVKKGNDWYLNGEKVNEQFAGGFPFTKRGDSWYYTGEGENSKIVPGEGEYDLDINLVLDAKSAAIAKYENKSGGNAR